MAHFSNRDMRTAVYGTPALRDGSDSIYWYDHAANDPKHDLLGWHNDNYLGNWMHLYFTDKYRTQISNGVLLSLKDHYYAHNQRFTGEDHLRFLKKEMRWMYMKRIIIPGFRSINALLCTSCLKRNSRKVLKLL